MRILFLLFLCMLSSVFSASPVTHIYFAELWCQKHGITDKAFYIGTLFPDIRYLGTIDRDETHEFGLTSFDVLQCKNPFFSGMKLHAYLDEVRENFAEASGIYKKLPQENRATFLKLIEDEILYDRVNINKVCLALNELREEELQYNLAPEEIEYWHLLLRKYFQCRPKKLLQLAAAQNKKLWGVPAEQLRLFNELLPQLIENNEIQSYVEDLITHVRNSFF